MGASRDAVAAAEAVGETEVVELDNQRVRLTFNQYDHFLVCPRCRDWGECLHYNGRVTIYDRQEDDEDVTIIDVHDQIAYSCIMDNEKSRNPSTRRNALTIQFWCENCDGRFELCIAQHKGSSFIGWRVPA
jgi:hypothetical protein